jgi:hypothetical protein
LVTVDGKARWAKELVGHRQSGVLADVRDRDLRQYPAVRQWPPDGGKDLLVLPAHQADPGSLAQRSHHQQQLAWIGRNLGAPWGTKCDTVAIDGWVILFTIHRSRRRARRPGNCSPMASAAGSWRRRGAVGWDLERTLGRVTAEARVERVWGAWAP